MVSWLGVKRTPSIYIIQQLQQHVNTEQHSVFVLQHLYDSLLTFTLEISSYQTIVIFKT